MEPRQRKFAIGLLAIILIAISVIQFSFFATRAANVSYSRLDGGTRPLSWILPALVSVGVWVLVMRRFSPHQGLTAIGKNKEVVGLKPGAGPIAVEVSVVSVLEARGPD